MNDITATSFGTAAADYEAGRPTYPAAAVAWLLGEEPLDVVDVGAGTGKLTEVIGRLGHSVRAVDPDPRMLAALRSRLPEVETSQGTAESLPIADASVDAVTFGQSWHWVDVEAASAEAARVLRPLGRVCLIWNIKDVRVPWVADLATAIGESQAESLIHGPGPSVGAPFTQVQHYAIDWEKLISGPGLTAMARSRSSYIVGDPAGRERIDTAVASIVAGLTDLADGGEIRLPYVTHALVACRP